MNPVRLPSHQVVSEARVFLKAARLIEKYADNDNTDLFWPAAMNAGLASELYLKSFLVDYDLAHPGEIDDPEWFLSGKKGHNLVVLYKAIPSEYAEKIRQISERLSPGFQLERRLDDCSKLFVGTRYTYEHGSIQGLDTDVFELAPHLDLIIAEMMIQTVSS
jgi:hypothetical protein